MKTFYRRATLLSVLLALLLPLLSVTVAAHTSRIDRYLVVGMDDAASNTDVMAVISYSHADRAVTVLQIPRDTYYFFGGEQNKLNQLYPHLLGGRDTRAAKELAMKGLASAVSSLLGVSVSTYIAVSLSDFSLMIDRIGGVPMRLPIEITYRDEESGETVVLPRGVHTLSGKAASAFVRYRAGYATGDLGRIDAQKLFISSLFAKLASGITPRTMTSVFGSVRRSLITNLTLPEAISCGICFMRRYKGTQIHYLTLPGAAAFANGISYYSVCRTSASEAVEKWLLFEKGKADIDVGGKGLARDIPPLAEIYHRKAVHYRVYTDAELKE